VERRFVQQSGLANAAFAREEHAAGRAGGRGSDEAPKPLQVGLASHHDRGPAHTPCHVAQSGASLSPWRPRMSRGRDRRTIPSGVQRKEPHMTITETELDPQLLEAAAGKVLSIYSGSMLNYMIDIGHRTGLLAAAAQGSGTSEQLAARAGLTERYVREWLAAMVTGGVFEYDPATTTYTLPAEAAVVLTGGPLPLAVMSGLQTHLAKHVHEVARAFREGGGVPYSAYQPEFTDLLDQIGRVWYDSALVDAHLALVDGLTAQLEAGAAVADIACGTGHAVVVLARRFPASTFAGCDLDEGAVAPARAEASGAGFTNGRFAVADAPRLGITAAFGVVL